MSNSFHMELAELVADCISRPKLDISDSKTAFLAYSMSVCQGFINSVFRIFKG
jgi:hypothetical protein